MKRSLISMIVATTLTTAAYAGDMDTDNKWEKGAKDAWIDGKAEATLLFNGNLDSFDINTDVKNGNVVLTGKVENSVDKKLAEELVANIDGVTSVDNKLTVVSDKDMEGDMSDDMEDTVDEGTSELTDAKIATVIKTRLLMDTDISGFDIDVDVENGVVTLTGDVDSDAERDLAVEIAKNASDVKDVESNLRVVTETAMNYYHCCFTQKRGLGPFFSGHVLQSFPNRKKTREAQLLIFVRRTHSPFSTFFPFSIILRALASEWRIISLISDVSGIFFQYFLGIELNIAFVFTRAGLNIFA